MHLWPTLPIRGTHNTPSLHHPRTSQSTSTSGTQPQLSPRTVVLPQLPTVVQEGPAPSVKPKQPTLPGRPAHNSSSNTSSNNRFATYGRPRPQQPLLLTPHNRPTTYPKRPANLTSRAAQSQRSSILLTNRFLALQDQHS